LDWRQIRREAFLAQMQRVLPSDIYATALAGGGADRCAEGWRFTDGGRVFRRRMLLVSRVVAATLNWNLPRIAG
jgi:hypothetical protein